MCLHKTHAHTHVPTRTHAAPLTTQCHPTFSRHSTAHTGLQGWWVRVGTFSPGSCVCISDLNPKVKDGLQRQRVGGPNACPVSGSPLQAHACPPTAVPPQHVLLHAGLLLLEGGVSGCSHVCKRKIKTLPSGSFQFLPLNAWGKMDT